MRYTEALRWGILGGLSLLLFIPFIIADGGLYPNMFFPFITGKNFTFRILVELLLGLYILLALREPKYRPQASLLMWAATALLVWVGLATILSVDPEKSFWSNFERMEGYLGLIHVYLLFIIAGAVLTVEEWWQKFFKVSIVVATLQGLYGLFQMLGWASISSQSGARLDTSFGNATYLAVYLLFNIFITLYILVRERQSRTMQSLYGISLTLQAVALFNTETRGAILGLIGGLILTGLYIIWQARDTKWKVLRKWSIGSLVGLVVLGGVFVAAKDTSFIRNSSTLNRLASISLADATTQSRFIIWGVAYEGFKEKPLLGWGQENFSYVFNEHYDPQMYDQEQWFDRAHNQFLDWLLAAGLPAFVLFLSFFFLGAWMLYRSSLEPPAQAVLIGLLGAYGFHSLFVFDNLISAMYFFLILAFLHSLTPRKVPRFLALSRPLSDHGVAIAAPIVGVMVVLCIWVFNAPALARATSIIDAITTQRMVDQNGSRSAQPRDPKENIAVFERVLTMGRLGQQEVVEQLYTFASGVASDNAVSPAIKEEAYALARREGEKFLLERPDDARLELFLASFLNQFGRSEEALQHFERALELSPNKQQILYQYAFTKVALDDPKGALELFKRAFEVAPENDEARIYYAMGLYYNGQMADGDTLLEEKFGTVAVDNERLIQLYTSLKMYSRVIAILEKRILANPTDAQLRVSLASAYFTSGDKVKTIETLRKAAEIEPSLAGQIQSLITQIQNGTLQPNQ